MGTAAKRSPSLSARYRRSAVSTGVSGLDICLLFLVSASWEKFHTALGWVGVTMIVVLVLVPFVVASLLTRTCTAWNGVAEGRCKKPRPWAARCEIAGHGRMVQLITFPEVAALISLALGVLGGIVVLNGMM